VAVVVLLASVLLVMSKMRSTSVSGPHPLELRPPADCTVLGEQYTAAKRGGLLGVDTPPRMVSVWSCNRSSADIVDWYLRNYASDYRLRQEIAIESGVASLAGLMPGRRDGADVQMREGAPYLGPDDHLEISPHSSAATFVTVHTTPKWFGSIAEQSP